MKYLEKKVIFIQGSTAVGKSSLALELAKKNNGAIINCDSIQCYKHLYIGSAQPTEHEKSIAPHYLYDFVTEKEEITAGNYRKVFFETIEQIEKEYIFVVGGTGFYFQAIERGMYPVEPSDTLFIRELENEIKAKGSAYLWMELNKCDPETAKTVSQNDHYRLTRAIEIIRKMGSLTEIKKRFYETAKPFPYKLLKIGLLRNKSEMQDIVATRTKNMIHSGLIEEVKQVLKIAQPTWAPLNSVGYKEVMSYLAGQILFEELEDKINLSTLKLIKKQITWFKRDKDVNWFYPDHQLILGEADMRKLNELLGNL